MYSPILITISKQAIPISILIIIQTYFSLNANELLNKTENEITPHITPFHNK